MAEKKRKCPECGAEMNHHADKLVEPTNPEEARAMDQALDGFIEATYECPDCGHIESVRLGSG